MYLAWHELYNHKAKGTKQYHDTKESSDIWQITSHSMVYVLV